MPRVLRVLAGLVALLSLVAAGRIVQIGYGPPPGNRALAAQVGFLDRTLDRGGPERMQQLFPEGAFFLTALTASAATQTTEPNLARLRELRGRLDAPEMIEPFGSSMQPEHGIFWAGWSLSVAVDVATLSRQPEDLAAVERRATAVATAVGAAPSPFLAGYPSQFWPCDTVVAVTALVRAGQLLDHPQWLTLARAWRTRALAAADPATGLLPHRVDAAGRALEGPRGSSQAIIQAFWPDLSRGLDGRVDTDTWQRFRGAFVVGVAGLVGVREYPRGTSGFGDVDSGPLILGVSASASAVTLAGARQVGDVALAGALSREAELLGLPISWPGQRRYALGLVPVGDAFLAWARSQPLGPPQPVEGPRPAWPAMIALALLPAMLVAVTTWAVRRTRVRR